jgi:hypothetical protein
LTLSQTNVLRSQVGEAFEEVLKGSSKSQQRAVLHVQNVFDDIAEAQVKNPASLALLRKQREIRSAAARIYTDKGSDMPQLARFLGDNTDLRKFLVGNSKIGDFNTLVKQVRKAPNGEEALNGIRSALLDEVERLASKPNALQTSIARPGNLLRAKLNNPRVFYDGFADDAIKAAEDAKRFAAVREAMNPIRGIGTRQAFGLAGGGAAIGGATGGGLGAAIGGGIGAAAPIGIETLLQGSKAAALTGAGRRAGAAALGQGARAGTQRKLDQLRQASERGGVR